MTCAVDTYQRQGQTRLSAEAAAEGVSERARVLDLIAGRLKKLQDEAVLETRAGRKALLEERIKELEGIFDAV